MTLFMIETITIRHSRALFMNYGPNMPEIIKKAGI